MVYKVGWENGKGKKLVVVRIVEMCKVGKKVGFICNSGWLVFNLTIMFPFTGR